MKRFLVWISLILLMVCAAMIVSAEGEYDYVIRADGMAIIVRAGLEFNPDPFYARADVSWISDVYGDDAQCLLSGVVGVKATDDVRFDLSGRYYAEWEEYYVLIGFTLVR